MTLAEFERKHGIKPEDYESKDRFKPIVTDVDKATAQALFTAIMTDTLLEDEEDE